MVVGGGLSLTHPPVLSPMRRESVFMVQLIKLHFNRSVKENMVTYEDKHKDRGIQ